MSKCTVEIWKMKDIYNALSSQEHNGKKIVIPRFQRGQRWSSQQEATFIDSLKRGYPVGTILFYKTNEVFDGKAVDVYTLVDGLQRSTAISRYIKEPMKYFDKEFISDDFLKKIYDILGFQNQEHTIFAKVKEIISNYIQSLDKLDGEHSFELAKLIANEITTVKDKLTIITELMRVIPSFIEDCQKDYQKIANADIPAVVYIGEEDELPEIFNRINSKGTPLNTYEIYAASWPQKEKIVVNNEFIVSHVIKKYDALNDDIYSIRDYDKSAMLKSKELTTFEYVFGLSKWINERYSFLGFERNNKVDEISTIGFELLDACLFDSKTIGELYKKLRELNINRLEKRLVECIEYVESIIRPIIRFKGNSRRNDNQILYAKNQIISMIAFVFRERVNISDLKINKEEWDNKEVTVRKQLYYYFLYDILRKEWFEGGGKIHTVLNSKRYFSEITPNMWETALNSMFQEGLNRKETKNVKGPSNIDIVFLNAIYVNKFSAMDQLSFSRFDIEHIATKDLMKKLIVATCPEDELEGLPISSIANLCYLPEYQNRAKGNKTFYQDSNYLNGLTLSDVETKYSFTKRTDLEWLDLDYEQGDFDSLQEFYMAFLTDRFNKLKSEFYIALEIDASLITNSYESISAGNTIQSKEKHDNATISLGLGTMQTAIYQSVRETLESKDKETLSFSSKTVLDGMDKRYILSYSKSYPNKNRNKYWFAYRPDRVINDGKNTSHVFICNGDNIKIVIPIEFLDQKIQMLNSSIGDNGKPYYHIVILVYTNGNKKDCKWLLSRPSLREEDLSEYVL